MTREVYKGQSKGLRSSGRVGSRTRRRLSSDYGQYSRRQEGVRKLHDEGLDLKVSRACGSDQVREKKRENVAKPRRPDLRNLARQETLFFLYSCLRAITAGWHPGSGTCTIPPSEGLPSSEIPRPAARREPAYSSCTHLTHSDVTVCSINPTTCGNSKENPR